MKGIDKWQLVISIITIAGFLASVVGISGLVLHPHQTASIILAAVGTVVWVGGFMIVVLGNWKPQQ